MQYATSYEVPLISSFYENKYLLIGKTKPDDEVVLEF